MKLYFSVTDAAEAPPIEATDKAFSLQCATVVLRHPGGSVGFDEGDGARIMRAMLLIPIVLEVSNPPGWLRPTLETMSCQSVRGRFRRFVTCEGPDERFVSELEVVAANLKRSKQNEIRRRHEKPTSPLVPTVFDDWVSPAGQPRLSSLAEFSSMCSQLIY